MIRASIFAFTVLMAAPVFAAPETDGHTHQAPDFVLTEAPTDRVVGDANAANTMIMYASNVCPHCGSWFAKDWPIVKSQLIETGKLRFVFRPLPSQPIQLSLTGFIMAECAADGDYMTVMEDQFERQPTILRAVNANDSAVIKSEYDQVAKLAGLNDTDSITACLSEASNLEPLQTSADRAAAADISDIPSFIFNGTIMSGASDAEAIKGWVEGRSSARP